MLQKTWRKWKVNSPIGEIFANHKSDKGLVARIFVDLLQHKNKKIPVFKKWMKNRRFWKYRRTNGNKYIKECSPSVVLENASQNHNEIAFNMYYLAT